MLDVAKSDSEGDVLEMEKQAVSDAPGLMAGLCGWTDSSLVKCGLFYPSGVSGSDTRSQLRHYASIFPCVEVDSCNYSLPSPARAAQWTQCVPNGFTFHIKAFGMLANRRHSAAALPAAVRTQLPPNLVAASQVKWTDLSEECRNLLWDMQNDFLGALVDAGKMGVVLFQFHSDFAPTALSREWVRQCRERLRSDVAMVVEFRNRQWLSSPTARDATRRWVAGLRAVRIGQCEDDTGNAGVGLACVDELIDELAPNAPGSAAARQARLQRGYNVPSDAMPIHLLQTNSEFLYIRVHRREGKHRKLSCKEVEAWQRRLIGWYRGGGAGGAATAVTKVWMLWGTAHEDQPIQNAKALADAASAAGLPVCDWEAKHHGRKGIQGFFQRAKKAKPMTPEKTKERATRGSKAGESGGQETKKGKRKAGGNGTGILGMFERTKKKVKR